MQLRRVERDQVGVVEALRIELPARCDEPAHLFRRQPALRGRQAAQLNVLVADPSERAQHRQRLRVLRLVAVVEREHDRFACTQGRTRAPGGLDLVQCHRVPAGALERAHLFGELGRRHVQAREGCACGRVRDHVVHENRNRLPAWGACTRRRVERSS